MLAVKKIIALVFLTHKLGECLEWFPVASPYFFQTDSARRLQIMKPPLQEPAAVEIPQFLANVDFRKPKTQSFYKTALIPAQPPLYEFRYKVHDPKEENYQEKSETRVGDSVRGYYSVREPNGYVRVVKYVSDENGFQTQVSHHHADDNGGGYLFALTRRVT